MDFDDFLDEYPSISTDDPCPFHDFLRRANALISYYLHIPFPEQLDDDTWCEKYRQFQWLLAKGHLPIKLKE